MPVTVEKAKVDREHGFRSSSSSVTEIVTHVAQHGAIGRNMALLRPCAFDIATGREGERWLRL